VKSGTNVALHAMTFCILCLQVRTDEEELKKEAILAALYGA
jgi:hypothetical protein